MNTADAAYRIVSFALFSVGIGISGWHRNHADQEGGKVPTAAEPMVLLVPLRLAGILFLGSNVAWLINPEWTRWASVDLPAAVRWAGAAAGLICLPAIWWVFTSLGTNVSPTVLTRKNHTLVTHGPYRWVRHPLYTVGALFWIGLSVLMANVVVLITGALVSTILVRRTSIEERQLVKRFGIRYRRYMSRTGRFLPLLGSEAGRRGI